MSGSSAGQRHLALLHVPPQRVERLRQWRGCSWWFGFDCGHFDAQPGWDARMRDLDIRLGQIEEELPEDHPMRRRYASLSYVRAECRHLAAPARGGPMTVPTREEAYAILDEL